MEDEFTSPQTKSVSDAKKQRLAEQLRANLRKRKDQKRIRAAQSLPASPESTPRLAERDPE